MDKQQKIDAIFMKAKLVSPSIPFTETKDVFLRTLDASITPPKGRLNFFNFKTILIMIGIISILSFIISFSSTSEDTITPTSNPENNEPVQTLFEKNTSLEGHHNIAQPIKFQKARKSLPEIVKLNIIPLGLIGGLSNGELIHLLEFPTPRASKGNQSSYDNHSPFPKLTDKEISANHKQKKKMIKALSKLDRKKYAYVPSGSYLYKDKTVSVQAFHMQRTEVSNLEYRTFLFDLLIQGRKDEFLRAAPDQTLWTRILSDTLKVYQDEYFSDPALNEFPVVNITQDGAKMYCDWITNETNKTRANKARTNEPMNDVRLPELLEWTYAASSAGVHKTYPWDGETLSVNGDFRANFKLSEFDGDLSKIEHEVSVPSARTTFEHTFGFMITSFEYYQPNGLGLYNISGNVAEIVSVNTTASADPIEITPPNENQVVTCGGSWMSPVEDLEIFNERYSEDINGHPSIGFRVVITHTGRFN